MSIKASIRIGGKRNSSINNSSGAVPEFDPNSISGLLFYADMQDNNTFTDVGAGVISRVHHKYNAATYAEQTDNTKRGVKTANVLNGKQGLTLDGTNDWYLGPSIFTAAYTKVLTFRVTGFETGGSTNIYNLLSSNTSAGHSFSFFLNGTSMRIRDAFAGNMTYDIPGINSNGVFTFIRTVTNGAQNFYLNGQLVSTQAAAYSNAVPGWILGSFNNGAANTFFRGHIGDVAIYNKALSPAEVLSVDTWQKTKYRIPNGNKINVLKTGQSNERGSATVKSADNTEFIGLDYIYTIRHFRDLKDSTGEGVHAASIGSCNPPFVNRLNTLTGKKIIVNCAAKLGSFISTTGAGGDNSLHWGSTGTLRSNAIAQGQAMIAQTGGSLDWIEINQGEADANYMISNPSWTQALYKVEYLDLINAFKSAFPGVKILIVKTVTARLAGTDTALNAVNYAKVQNAQQEIADEESDVFIDTTAVNFNTSGGQLQADGLHYSQTGNSQIGIACANTMFANM